MKNDNNILSLLAIIFFSLLVIGCQEAPEPVQSAGKGQINFSFNNAADIANQRTSVDSTTVVNQMLISIKDSTGAMVLDRKNIEVYEINGEYISENIQLPAGSYQLTEFLVMHNNQVLYAAPKSGSEYAGYVNNPLPIDFQINPDSTTQINPEVLKISDNITGEEFGYVTFSFNIVGDTTMFPYECLGFDTLGSQIIIRPDSVCGEDAQITNSLRQNSDDSVNYKHQNWGEEWKLKTAAWTASQHGSEENDWRSLIRFPGIHQINESIDSAKLVLYYPHDYTWLEGGRYGNNEASIHLVTESWDENQVTWVNQPSYESADSVVIPRNNSYDSLVINVSSLVNKIRNNPDVYHGFLIKQTNEDDPYRSMVFSSSEYYILDRRPKLILDIN